MGSTYETLLMTADFDATGDALRGAGVITVVAPPADNRVAVLPREGEWNSAPVNRSART